MTTNHTLSIRTDVPSFPAREPATRYILVSFTAPEAQRTDARPPVNVSFVLDRSGSMGGQKIALARQAVKDALGLLRADDRFSLVAYDHEVDVVVETVPASVEARRNAVGRLEGIDARGQTNLAGGWEAGCEAVAPHLAEEPAGRCLLLTDGLANVGETDREALVARARALRQRHIVTSTFGVGVDFDEVLLQRIASESGGHFYFIEQAAQIPDLLTSELGETLEVVARGASVSLQLPAGAKAEPLTRYEWCPTDSGIRIALGDLASRQEVEVVIRIDLPAMPLGDCAVAKLAMSDQDGAIATAAQELRWETTEGKGRGRRDRVVDRAVARLYAARAREEALALNRAGEFRKAAEVLERTARRIESYAGRDADLRAIAAGLRALVPHFGEMMSGVASKTHHFVVYSQLHGRAADGKARRRE